MKRIITVALLSLAMLACMGTLCDMSSHNTPYTNPADTMAVKHLDTALTISATVIVTEWDKSTRKITPSYGANVYCTSSDTNVTTDSTGYARLVFRVDSIPYSYIFTVTKEGYAKSKHSSREINSKITTDIMLYKPN